MAQASDNDQMDNSSDSDKGETSSQLTVIHGTNTPDKPPNIKLKQTEPQSPVAQKKQTARDDKSGETSHNAQERNGSIMPETGRDIKEEKPSKSDHALQLNAEGKIHSFQFCIRNGEINKVVCDASKTVFGALNENGEFQSDKEGKEIIIRRSKGQKAAVKTDFPCCLIEDDETLQITFYNAKNIASNQETTTDTDPKSLVTFYIRTRGMTKKIIMKGNNVFLENNIDYVCVFAHKGDTIEEALQHDGRFSDDIFDKAKVCKLVDGKINYPINLLVDCCDGKKFELNVKKKENSDKNDGESVKHSQQHKNTKQKTIQEKKTKGTDHSPEGNATQNEAKKKTGPKMVIQNCKEIRGILRDQFEDLLETLKQRENLKNKTPEEVQKFFREEYHKSVENFLEVKKVKELMRLSDSVCQIRENGSAVGTGFLLFDRFILTNAHVIGISTDLTTMNVAQFTAVFDYEDRHSPIKGIPVKQLIAYFYGKDDSGRYLDYALLELDLDLDSSLVDKIAEYPKLLSCYSPNPPINRGQICILGHPDQEVKRMDPCIIIEREDRLKAENKHKSEYTNFIDFMTQKSLEEKWDFFDNEITYDSCFFHGSSGSPVFDVDCNLIGVHTGGYKYKEEGPKIWSVMEYGFTMQPILENIRARAKIKGLNKIVNILEPYINKSNVSGAAVQQNQTDYEMSNAEEPEES